MAKNSRFNQQLAQAIRHALQAQNKTQVQLAKEMKIGPKTVGVYLRGNRSLLTGTARAMLDKLGVEIVLKPIQKNCGDCLFFAAEWCQHPSNGTRKVRVNTATPACPSWKEYNVHEGSFYPRL